MKKHLMVLALFAAAFIALSGCNLFGGEQVKDCGEATAKSNSPFPTTGEVLECFNDAFLGCEKAKMVVLTEEYPISVNMATTGNVEGGKCEIVVGFFKEEELILETTCQAEMKAFAFAEPTFLSPESCTLEHPGLARLVAAYMEMAASEPSPGLEPIRFLRVKSG